MTLRDTLLEIVDYDPAEANVLAREQLFFLEGIEVKRSWLGSFFADPYDVSETLWDCASNDYSFRVIMAASGQNSSIFDALRAIDPAAADQFINDFNLISSNFNSAIKASGGFTLSQYAEDISGFTEAFFGSAFDLVLT